MPDIHPTNTPRRPVGAPRDPGDLMLAWARDRIDTETATVRAGKARAEGQAGTLLNHTTTLAWAALTVLLAAGQRLRGPAELAGWLTVGLLLAATVLLVAATTRRISGDVGLGHWAKADDPRQRVEALTAGLTPPSAAECGQRTEHLLRLTRAWHRTERVVQTARVLQVLALAPAVLAVVWAR